jgi:hypothetical protein
MKKSDCVPVKIEPLLGTVKLYQRHLVVCTGPLDWPERIETGGGFLQALTQTMAQRAPEMSLPVKMTACDEASMDTGYDILVFPDNVRYLGVQRSDISVLVEEQLVGNRVSDAIPHQPVTKPYVFVCTHGRRDLRCGQCGLPLLEAFTAELERHNLQNEVIARGSSHVGGHMFAGNVLVYPEGDWYGYVTPADVPRLVEQHLVQKQIVSDLWRGRMGLSQREQIELGSLM